MPSETSSIKVYAKVRPLTVEEEKKKEKVSTRADKDKLVIDAAGKDHSFSLDGCFSDGIRNSAMLEEKGQGLLAKALEGYNVALVTAGQSGSGKTYTMTGNEEDPGLAICTIRSVFGELAKRSGQKDLFVSCSYVEFRDDEMLDLLNPHGRHMTVRQHPQLGTYVDGLSEMVVRSVEELEGLYWQGCKARKVSLADRRGHPPTASTIFTIYVEHRDKGSDKGRRAKVMLVDLAGLDLACKSMQTLSAVITGLKQKTHAPYRESDLTKALQEVFGGSCLTAVFGCVTPTERASKASAAVWSQLSLLRGVKNQAWLNPEDVNLIVDELREEIGRVRDKVAGAAAPDRDDIAKLEDLLRDLQVAKDRTWEERERASKHVLKERPSSLANRGLVDWVLGAMSEGQREYEEKMSLLQREKEQLSRQYKDRRQAVDMLKAELETRIADYSKLAEKGKASESDTKKRVAAIHESKEKLKRETEAARALKQKLRDTQDRIRLQKEDAQADNMALKGNLEMRRTVEEEERARLEEENKALIAEELEKMKLEIEEEKASIQLKVGGGKQYSQKEGAALEVQLAELKAERALMTLKLQTVEEEKNLLQKDLNGAYRRHKDELELQQLQHFQTFREYREVFERQKAALEERWRNLVEDAVRDAVYLSATNAQHQQEKTELEQQIAVLKDQVTSLGGRPQLVDDM